MKRLILILAILTMLLVGCANYEIGYVQTPNFQSSFHSGTHTVEFISIWLYREEAISNYEAEGYQFERSITKHGNTWDIYTKSGVTVDEIRVKPLGEERR